MDETPLEASPEDVADQRAEVAPGGLDDAIPAPVTAPIPWDADPADYSDQQAEVRSGDDDWA